jgi:hypothetical protein
MPGSWGQLVWRHADYCGTYARGPAFSIAALSGSDMSIIRGARVESDRLIIHVSLACGLQRAVISGRVWPFVLRRAHMGPTTTAKSSWCAEASDANEMIKIGACSRYVRI